MTRAQDILEKLSRQEIARFGTKKSKKKLYEISPPGFEGTVKALKKRHSKEVDNPYALAWYMKNKGYQSHKKKTGGPKDEMLDPYHPAVQMSTKIPASQKRIRRKKHEDREAHDLAYAMYDKGPLAKKRKRKK